MTQNSFETPLVADLGQAMPDQRLRDVRVGVITFPGTLDDRDAMRAVEIAGGTPVRLWHADDDLHGVDAVILPGGFSYGDYLRAGAISRFAPLMTRLIDAANGGLHPRIVGARLRLRAVSLRHFLRFYVSAFLRLRLWVRRRRRGARRGLRADMRGFAPRPPLEDVVGRTARKPGS